mmetsp:Transcript_65081/g.103112  ORF Transcript_65081/g.103112 Transcript_65081/m.103112 type:complete len:265 (-) Transcript_65081:2971-3765(-)
MASNCLGAVAPRFGVCGAAPLSSADSACVGVCTLLFLFLFFLVCEEAANCLSSGTLMFCTSLSTTCGVPGTTCFAAALGVVLLGAPSAVRSVSPARVVPVSMGTSKSFSSFLSSSIPAKSLSRGLGSFSTANIFLSSWFSSFASSMAPKVSLRPLELFMLFSLIFFLTKSSGACERLRIRLSSKADRQDVSFSFRCCSSPVVKKLNSRSSTSSTFAHRHSISNSSCATSLLNHARNCSSKLDKIDDNTLNAAVASSVLCCKRLF